MGPLSGELSSLRRAHASDRWRLQPIVGDMTRILIRAGRPPHAALSNEAATAWGNGGTFNWNTGNMLYSDAVFRALNVPGAEILCDGYVLEQRDLNVDQVAGLINDHFDAYVLPMADVFKLNWAQALLPRLTPILERLTIPVVVPCIGVSENVDPHTLQAPAEIVQASRSFIRAVLERSASIGVRGEITAGFVKSLGFSDATVDIVGCPSLSAISPDLQVAPRVESLTRTSPLAINLIKRDPWGEFYQRNAEMYEDLVLVLQDIAAAEFVLWGREPGDAWAAGLPSRLDHSAVIAGKITYFTHPRPWLDFLRGRDFAFGSRLHGCIAALLAGTPAFLMTVDPRTNELADYHGIPHADAAALFESGDLLANRLYERTDLADFHRLLPENSARFGAFLERNGLAHVAQPGQANAEYAAALEQAVLPHGALPPSMADPTGLATRLRWLWQSRDTDHLRPVGAHCAGLAFPDDPVDPPDKLAATVRDQGRLTSTIIDLHTQLANELAAQREHVMQLEARLAKVEQHP